LLVTVPVPADFEVQLEETERVLAEALDEAEKLSVSGRDITPFLLKQMSEKSDGATLKANTALLENNARIAAEIATSICAVGKAIG
jgi:pseudouridine-5'-phosphate glycosidase